MNQQPAQRVSPIRSPDDYALPGRPEGASTLAQDAYRQTQFLLGGDLKLFEESMNLQLRLVKDAYPSRYRTHALAGIIALWSRAYFYFSDAVLLLSRGSYSSVLPLVRNACEVVAAEEGLRLGSVAEHSKWLLQTLRPEEDFKAFEFELGRFFAGDVLANDALLKSVYRPASELARPNFGATLLQVGPESNNNRLAIAFADAAFHQGWAELSLGWLLALSLRQIRVIVDAEPVFPISDEARSAYEDLQRRVDEALGSPDRCSVEEVERDGRRRYLVHNFRRVSSGAPKKVVL